MTIKPFNQRVELLAWSLLAALLLSQAGCSNVSVKEDWRYSEQAFEQNLVPVCHDFGCKRVTSVALSGVVWDQVTQLFQSPAHSPQAERQRIAQAIALMEQHSGLVTGSSNDRAENSGNGEPGQQDCIDESTNTTNYLRLFEHKSWLRWHLVESRAVRSHYLLDVHWTAVIRDKQSQQRYAVDSWFKANGKSPLIIKLEEWLAKRHPR